MLVSVSLSGHVASLSARPDSGEKQIKPGRLTGPVLTSGSWGQSN